MSKNTLCVGATTLLRALHRALSFMEIICVTVASLCILTVMAITGADVVLRYAVSSPLTWWYDVLMNYVLIAVFYLTFSFALTHHGHLAVDFFAEKMPEKVVFFMISLGFLVSAILVFLVGSSAVGQGVAAYIDDDVLAGVILWPVWVTKALVALGTLVLAFRSLHLSACCFIAGIDSSAFKRIGLVHRQGNLESVTQ